MPYTLGDSKKGGGSGGGSGYTLGNGKSSGGGKSSSDRVAHPSKALRSAIGAGNVDKVRRLAKKQGLSAQDRRGLVAVTKTIGGDGGIFGRFVKDVQSTASGLPGGIANLATGAANEVVIHPIQKLTGSFSPSVKGAPRSSPAGRWQGAIPTPPPQVNAIVDAPGISLVTRSAPAFGDALVTGKTDPNFPVSSSFGASFNRTGMRIAHPTQALKDYSAHPLQTALEDAGNLAVVTGTVARGASGASKLAESVGAETTASRLEQLSNLARTGERRLSQVANGPFLPVSRLARGANKGINKLSGKLADTRVGEVLHVTPAQRFVKNLLDTEHHTMGTTANEYVRNVARPIEKMLPKKAEQEALLTVGTRQADALAAIRRASPDSFDQFVTDHAQEFDNISVKGAHLAADYADHVNPELNARIDQALEIGRSSREARQQAYLAEGDVSQTGFAPVPAKVREAVAPLESKIPALAERAKATAKAASEARARADQAAQVGAGRVARGQEMRTIGEFGPNLEGKITSKDINAERAVARTGQSAARQTAEADVRAQMLETRARAAQRSLERAQAKASSVRANVEASIEAAPARLRPVLKSNRAAVQHLTGLENSLRRQGLHAQAEQLGQAAGEIPTTLAALEKAGIDPEHFIRTVQGDTFGEARVRPVKTVRGGAHRLRTGKGEGVRSVQAQTVAEIGRTRTVIRNETMKTIESQPWASTAGKVVGSDFNAPTLEELNQAGYAPLNPQIAKIELDTPVVPRGVSKMLAEYYKKDGAFEKTLQYTYDPATRAFKTMVLPLSPSWQVGNMVGNTIMATFGAGVDPVTLGINMVKSIREWKRTGELPGPARLRQSGSTFETQDYLGANKGLATGVRKLSPIRLGYAANETVDNLMRSAVYLSKKGAGYSDEMALRIALRAMGDFTKLSRFERRVVRRIVPFYAWQKHLAKLAGTLPIEHPLRTAFTLSLAHTFDTREDWEQILPGFLQSTVDVGGGDVLGLQNLVPFGTPVEWAVNPRSALSNLNPVLKAPIENITGYNTFTGKPFTRPPGSGSQDAFGNTVPTAPGFLQQLRTLSPQARLYDNLSGRNNVARYEDGSVVRFRGDDGKLHPVPTEVNDKKTLLKYLGLSIRSKKSLEQIADSIIAKKVRNWKSAHPEADTSK